jgi:D-glycero-beta-D-manno-heptose 1-phosphate adenylyltransferase
MIPWSEACKKKIITPHNLKKKSEDLKTEKRVIVTLNGSFDLLHAGHLYIIHQAKQLGDILIVALNTDASIRSYKGLSRPLIPLNERIEMMCAFEFVDYVTWFDEPDPRAILAIIAPHIHANGAEYGQNCIEADVVTQAGGRVHLVDRIPKLATSDLIAKIKSL